MEQRPHPCPSCGALSGLQSPRAIARAYRKSSSSWTRGKALNLILVVCDCLLIGLQPILVHMCKVDGHFPFSPVSVNLLTDLFKMLFAVVTLFIQERQFPRKPGSRLLSLPTLLEAMHSNRLLALPACLYAVNNYLKFIMQLYFKPATVKMLANLKVLMIALLLRSIMKRSFTTLQWEALCLLLIGICVNQMACGADANTGQYSPVSFLAWVYTFMSISMPSTAAVYNEYALKSKYHTNVHLQNLVMYCFGMSVNVVLLVTMQLFQAPSSVSPWNIFHGHSHITMLLVANNALQGILSSFFFKYADTILKKYSSTIATIVTGLASAALFGDTLTVNFLLGVVVVIISMHQFFSSVDPQPPPVVYAVSPTGSAAHNGPSSSSLLQPPLSPYRTHPSSSFSSDPHTQHMLASTRSDAGDLMLSAGMPGDVQGRQHTDVVFDPDQITLVPLHEMKRDLSLLEMAAGAAEEANHISRKLSHQSLDQTPLLHNQP